MTRHIEDCPSCGAAHARFDRTHACRAPEPGPWTLDSKDAQRVIEQALYEAEVDGFMRSAGRQQIAERVRAALDEAALFGSSAAPPEVGE